MRTSPVTRVIEAAHAVVALHERHVRVRSHDVRRAERERQRRDPRVREVRFHLALRRRGGRTSMP